MIENRDEVQHEKIRYDHEVPFSRGENRTTDNVRIVEMQIARKALNRLGGAC